MIITVTAPYKKAVFTWDDALENCELKAHGFEDEEIDMLIENKVHEGADLDGYSVDIQ